jgi:hypothetical protein
MNGRIQGRRIRIRRSPSVAASLLTELNPFLVNVTGQSGYELNGLSSGASNVCIGWEWASKTPESMLMIDGDIHYAITELSPEDRREREKVNEAVRRYRESHKRT